VGPIEDIDDAAGFEVVDGRVLVEFSVGGNTRRFAMSVRAFRESIRRANRAADEWAEEHPGEVVPLSGRKRRP